MTHAQDGGVNPPRHAADPDPPPSTVDKKPVKVKRARGSGSWVSVVVVALVVLVLLLIFILQNLDTATMHFLGLTGSMPLAVAMLFAAVAGALLVSLIWAAWLLRLRKARGKR
ncbi:LapA family protein [Amycolatopsis anabasis]|uniref:LapA family protein n=1 Tax=Amycolatopsis anabasis TaxID=1840409 RepID=UPI001FE65669|nr:LapA family protein [Amycolatopsis anabasis]